MTKIIKNSNSFRNKLRKNLVSIKDLSTSSRRQLPKETLLSAVLSRPPTLENPLNPNFLSNQNS